MTEEERAYAKKVGGVLTEYKTAAKLSYEDLAEMTGLSRAHITRVLYGTVDVRVGDLRRLAKLFDVDPRVILDQASGAEK